MKSLFVHIIILLATVSTLAFEIGDSVSSESREKTLKFSWMSQRSYYACSYAEMQAGKYLRALGAQEISLSCNGGIQYGSPQWSWGPLNLKATFLNASVAEEKGLESTYQRVVFKGSEACEFNVKLIQTVLKEFDHKLILKRDSCVDADGSYRFEVDVLK